MIGRLRRRMTILVVAVLILVTAGIVFSINFVNWRNIAGQAEAALEILAENSGARPSLRRTEGSPPEKPDGEKTFTGRNPQEIEEGIGNHKDGIGQPPQIDNAFASLGNYYVVYLNSDESIESWTSDRADLYSDEQISDMTAMVLSAGRNSGRIGTQFYSLISQNGKSMLIVLDERLEILSAQRVLHLTLLVASLACLLLCIAAYFLIGEMVKPVQEAFDRQRQFVWDASHELKTPLAVIGANAEVLEGEIGENEYLGYIRSEVRRTNVLVQDLLTLARMDQGSVTANLQKTDLSKAVLAVALPFESSVFEAGKKLTIEVPPQIICTGDEAMLQQLTVILLSNALKYTDAGGEIILQVSPGGKYREIRVSNTGEGISPENLEKIFDRFYRADTSHNREIEGFGLGLSIAKKITDAHKGRIKAESEPGGLTVFTVTIPE